MLGILANGPIWEICPPKKKTHSINQCGEKGGGGITYRLEKDGKKKEKTLVLTNVGKRAVEGITYSSILCIWKIQNHQFRV